MAADRREDWFAIVEAIERGDKQALLKLTRVITGFLARYGAYQHRDSWDDLCQDVLLTLLQSVRAGKIREREAFVSYAGRVTHNKFIDILRDSRKTGEAEPEELATQTNPSEPEPRGPDQLIDLQKAVETLSDQERLVVQAVYLEGRSYQEAADRLELPLGTLKRLQTQGLRNLRERMGISRNH